MVSGSQLGVSLLTAFTFNVVGWILPMDAIGQPTRLVFAQDARDVRQRTSPSLPSAKVRNQSVIAQTGIKPGQYCYQSQTAEFKANLRLQVNAQGQIQGNTQATIENPKASYYTSYRQKFQGSLQPRSQGMAAAKLVTTTWIEYDVQTETVTWQISPERVKLDDGQILYAANCNPVNPQFPTDAGLEIADLTRYATVHRKTVQFRPGASSTTVRNSVVRAERDLYQLQARGGQTMTLKIQSLEKNAVFDVISPSGLVLSEAASQAQIHLPETGNYSVIVGGTRGNATYSLTIGID